MSSLDFLSLEVVLAMAALAFVVWRILYKRKLHAGLRVAAIGALVLWAGFYLYQQNAPGLPELTLSPLDGDPVDLQALRGQTVVVNLWATWCGPCRRELPALAQAQAENPDVHFVFANQGEDQQTVQDYLDEQGLRLKNVMLDRQMALMDLASSKALPTTLFYDRGGKLRYTHLGELSIPDIQDFLQQH